MYSARALHSVKNGLRRQVTVNYKAFPSRSFTSTAPASDGVFSKFMDTIKAQIARNKELKEGVKKLQEETTKISDSDALKRAKELFEKAKSADTNAPTENIKKTFEELKKSAENVTKTVHETVKDASDSEFAKATKDTVEKTSTAFKSATEPIRNTAAYQSLKKSVSSFVEEGSSRYGGIKPKEVRRKVHAQNPEENIHTHKSRHVAEDPTAGANMVMHKDSAWKESWNKFKDNNPVFQGVFRMKRSYEDSDNLFVAYARLATDRISETFGSLFEESETAQAIKSFQNNIDRSFNVEKFVKEAREYIIPEVMDAYLKGDNDALKEWCSEATYNVLTAGIQAQMQQGLVSDCKLLDLRNVEFVTGKLLDNDVPVFVLSFSTQEIIVFRNGITREIVFGQEDNIEQVTYACVLTKQLEDLQNPITGGWRVIDMAKHDARPTW
ncbi:TIM44 subunit of mitochondria import inner membrane translocase [Basidiobolus meristosporus CBS 931.73]|uniref:Mitochondrial import inner membrane translocase subunit TIM44 n=1 Tax=Basidiobolus meristosporus CBS 931.73 TaxID=1314790 RepID=A0A1Y1YI47_9FUNG|nr:TIM44 subunit of mitochondria import inner membrane translocase [Basidiobolus meristosporus CBS 931.73]|eukprot:ORX97645.1 TIM44 subunit of mitochondria import inner membrane translocase [Basidiobolus meristosporus CBS 931.73]